ncbi:hypothetical protein GCM10025869_07610 [Homoserinibacter gongjuensis]|uniref:Uncharacterized protein n=1 Tax=Homoserinibacter gongjuensis TaxID=1162968 RepID=A0ABQ6JR70_9MICO|nr:hypothetical protein GCM10025869_07610 [Homoserinibacter gongjuensis]
MGALQRERTQGRIDGRRSEGAGELADAGREQFVDVDVVDHVVLVGATSPPSEEAPTQIP